MGQLPRLRAGRRCRRPAAGLRRGPPGPPAVRCPRRRGEGRRRGACEGSGGPPGRGLPGSAAAGIRRPPGAGACRGRARGPRGGSGWVTRPPSLLLVGSYGGGDRSGSRSHLRPKTFLRSAACGRRSGQRGQGDTGPQGRSRDPAAAAPQSPGTAGVSGAGLPRAAPLWEVPGAMRSPQRER